MLLDQALFTSAQTARASGYHLVAWSGGVTVEDRKELSLRGPSHDSLLEENARSVNFHALPSGAYCVSSTRAEGAEFSQRRGPRIATRYVLISPHDFLAFANNPFRLLRAVEHQAGAALCEPGGDELPPVELEPGPCGVDECLLLGLLHAPGEQALLSFLNAALQFPCLGVAAGAFRNRLTAGLLSMLPVGCRTEFSFTTGLKYSPQRPFRLACLPDDGAERRRIERRFGLDQWSLGDEPRDELPEHAWVRVVQRVIARRELQGFSQRLSQFPSTLGTLELPLLAERMLHEWDASPADTGNANDHCAAGIR